MRQWMMNCGKCGAQSEGSQGSKDYTVHYPGAISVYGSCWLHFPPSYVPVSTGFLAA